MKKRMLVTTIALVLVIAVALTTSSLAWFSSSSAVTTGNVTFTATTATGANLVLGKLNERNLGTYDNLVAIELPDGTSMSPAQGDPTLVTLDTDFEAVNNTITYKTNPFLAATNVKQLSGLGVVQQQVDLVTGGKYLAGGFNYANATGDALENGVTVKATITLPTVERSVATATIDDVTKVKKGYVAFDGTWKKPGDTVTDAAVFFEPKNVALLASIRIAMYGAKDVITSGITFGNEKIYGYDGTGVVLTQNGYALAAGANQKKYVPGAPTQDSPYTGKIYSDATATYFESESTEIEVITDSEGKFTFSYRFAQPIDKNNAGSIAYVIWMDGWDESALPGVSEGTFSMTFEVSVG